jgi:hypothetical protein
MKERNNELEQISILIQEIVGKYDSDDFISEMASLCTHLGYGPIPFQPFDKFHSPQRQIFYLIALNLSAKYTEREKYNCITNPEQYDRWREIINLVLSLDKAYENIFFSNFDGLTDSQKEKATIAYPAFLNYYYSGRLEFEEQTIEKIEHFFSPFNAEIKANFGLDVNEFIQAYNDIDELLHLQLNRVLYLLNNSPECESFWDLMKNEGKSPKSWQYTGNRDIDELILLMKDQSEKLKINSDSISNKENARKVEILLNTIACNDKINAEFIYFTQVNFAFENPVYKLKDGRFLIIEIKQVIYAVYNVLLKFCQGQSKLSERFSKKRGKILEQKAGEIFRRFFNNDAHIYHEYDTILNKEQDVLIYHKGVVFIVELKASKRDTPSSNVLDSIKKIDSNFKEIFQKGHEQCTRVKKLFEEYEEVDLYNKKNDLLYTFKTRKIQKVFTLVVTLEKFPEIQTDLSLLLKLEGDETYPYSICIDDLEVLLLVMKREKMGLSHLINFLEQRVQFYGRLICKDELEICGEYFYKKKFDIPPGNRPIITHFRGTDIFENYYENGMGFKNEKNLDRKKSGKFINFGKPINFEQAMRQR